MKLIDKKNRNKKILEEFKELLPKVGGYKMEAYENLAKKYKLNTLHVRRIINEYDSSDPS